MARGCAAKISNLNTTSSIVLNIPRNGSKLLISGCAYNQDAGRYRVEVFDVEASGSRGQTAAVVTTIENTPSTPQTSTDTPSTTRGTQTTSEHMIKP